MVLQNEARIGRARDSLARSTAGFHQEDNPVRTLCLTLVCWLISCPVVAEPLSDVKIVNERAPDCSSLESMVETVTRGCRTDDEKAIAIYNFCRYVCYHHASPREPCGISALKLINVYGWSLCGGQHSVLAALWENAGFNWRYRGWRGHTTVEAFYGGRWHYFDTFLKFYTWAPDLQAPCGRIQGTEETNGRLDDFRVYNRALSDVDVSELTAK